MREIHFTKMAGAGNDFIVIDHTKNLNLERFTVQVCDRTNGIGADGVLVLDKSKKADYHMRIINADGTEAEMCGNGARCMAAYIVKTHRPRKNLFSIQTIAGILEAEAKGEVANVHLSNPKDYKSSIPLTIAKQEINVSYIDTGVPHVIVYVDHLKNINVKKIGEVIRYHKKFKPRGTNVNFVEQITKNLSSVRTYERGVEDETKACGTGSVATAIIAYLKSNPNVTNKKNARMKVQTASKEILEITFDLIDSIVSNVWLKGSAKFIAQGEYYL